MELVSDGLGLSLVSVAPERTLIISCWWKEGRGGRAGLFLHVLVTSQSAMMSTDCLSRERWHIRCGKSLSPES